MISTRYGKLAPSRLLCLLGLLGTLAACGTASVPPTPSEAVPTLAATADEQAVATDEALRTTYDIPIYPDASIPEEEGSISTVIENMKAQLADDAVGVVVEGYVLPEETTFEEVISFYDTELQERGWEVEGETGGTTFANGATGAWTRNNNQQGVGVIVMFDPTQNGRTIMFLMYGDR